MATTVRTPAADVLMTLAIPPGGLDRLLDLLGERSNPLVKYRQGRLLLVSPGADHERAVQRLDLLVQAISTALRIGIRGYRSTLFRAPAFDHGVEPDLTYYVQNLPAVRGVRGKINLTAYPPPDLAVEVVVSHSAGLAMEVCRELGVPELWVFDVSENRMIFWRRRRTGPAAGTYAPNERSLAFPVLRSEDVPPWLEENDSPDTVESARMRRWARTTLAARRKA
jgi:Uma2 family endonuclease